MERSQIRNGAAFSNLKGALNNAWSLFHHDASIIQISAKPLTVCIAIFLVVCLSDSDGRYELKNLSHATIFLHSRTAIYSISKPIVCRQKPQPNANGDRHNVRLEALAAHHDWPRRAHFHVQLAAS